MAFQLKDFLSISASMINHMRGTQTKITDFQPGSGARTLVEGPAVEIEELYMQMFIGLREAIPVAVFQSFGFDKLPPRYSRGFVSVSAAVAPQEAFVVPAGTEFARDDRFVYTSTQDVAWNAGVPTITVPVVAEAPGANGNTGINTITASTYFDTAFTIGNQPITSGRDAEREEDREARFSEFVQSLSQGTEIACIYAAKQASVRDEAGNILESVTRHGYTEIAGYFKIYVYSTRGIPSPELIADGQRMLDGYRDPDTGEPIVVGVRAAAIRGDVLPMSERAVSMGIRVRMRTGYALTNVVRQALLDTYAVSIRGVQPGSTLLIDNLRSALLGTRDVIEVALSSTQNITCDVSEALVPGNVTVGTI